MSKRAAELTKCNEKHARDSRELNCMEKYSEGTVYTSLKIIYKWLLF